MKSSRKVNWINKFFAPPSPMGNRPQRGLRRFIPKAAKQRDLYSEAIRFATDKLKRPEIRKFFKARSKGNDSAFTTAVAMYVQFHCPFDGSNWIVNDN